MKKTTFNGAWGSPQIIYGTGIFLGINFGFSITPEHDRGLNDIWKELGVPYELIPENFGLKMYTVTKFPKERFFFEKGETHTCLTFESGVEPLKGWQNDELENDPEGMATAWDDKSFGVVVPNQYSDDLIELYQAFERNDVCIMFNLDQTYVGYTRPYLWISILSRIKPGEEERAFQVHKEIYEKENQQIVEV